MNTKTKVAGLVVLAVLLTGCGYPFAKKIVEITPSSVSGTYREFEIVDSEAGMEIYTKALEKVQKQTKGKKLEQVQGYWGYNYGHDYGGDDFSPPTFKLEQPILGYFKLDNHEYWVVESEREYVQKSAREHTWWEATDENAAGATYQLYKDGKFDRDVTEIFGQTLCWGIDGVEGMVNDITWVAGDIAFKYIVGGECTTTSTVHAYIQGMPQEKVFRIDQSRYPFDYKGKPGFVGKIEGKEYLIVDGRIVSEGYDKIYTNSCCAMHTPVFELYDDGYLYFIGIRDHKAFVIETNIETFESELILKTNVDKNTLKK